MSTAEKRPRGRDVRKMDKPYTCREVMATCSNGWTIERVSPEDAGMEGFFMGHCLGLECAVGEDTTFSLREPDGTPHVTIHQGVMVGRCNQAPKKKYQTLVLEGMPRAYPQEPSQFQLDYRRPEDETLDTVSAAR